MLLSIGIPTYNRKEFLEKSLETLLPQIQDDMEIVISDNGSLDATLSCLEGYKQKYPFVNVVGFDFNQGIDRNIVNVIEHSRGKYVFLFSDDDLFPTGGIKHILANIRLYKPLVLCLNHFAFYHPSIEERTPPFLSKKDCYMSDGWLFFKKYGLGFLSSLIFRRDLAMSKIGYVRIGKECAHLDIVSRIVLEGRGPYIFLGSVCIAGRSLPIPRYDLMSSCVFNLKELYDSLLEEALLTHSQHLFFIKRLFYKETPRILYKLIKIGDIDLVPLYESLQRSFQELMGTRIAIKVYQIVDRHGVLLAGSLARILLRIYRKIRGGS